MNKTTIKKQHKETQPMGVFKSALDNINIEESKLSCAQALQTRAAENGFEFPTAEQAFDKCVEEMNEFMAAIDAKDIQAQEEEFGDLIFALTNYARMNNINAEEAVHKANHKFINRFQSMEKSVDKTGITLKDLSLEQLLDLWKKQK